MAAARARVRGPVAGPARGGVVKRRRRSGRGKPAEARADEPSVRSVVRDDVPRPCGCVETWEVDDQAFVCSWVALTYCETHDPTRAPDWGSR